MNFKSSNYYKKKMEEVAEKLRVYKKKNERMGLSEEEKELERDLIIELFLLREEIVDCRLEEVFFPLLYNAKTKQLLKTIQNYLPWHGGKLVRNKDVDEILDKFYELNSFEIEIIKTSLMSLHSEMLSSFETFYNTCSDKELEWMKQISDFISGSVYSNTFDVIYFIDERYRILAELIDIELPDLDINFTKEDA